MKKYLLILILSITMCIGISSVEAENEIMVTKIQYNEYFRSGIGSKNVIVAKQFTGENNPLPGIINDNFVFCNDIEKGSKDGTLYLVGEPVTVDTPSEGLMVWFFKSGSYTALHAYEATQVLNWEMNGDLPTFSDIEIQNYINEIKNAGYKLNSEISSYTSRDVFLAKYFSVLYGGLVSADGVSSWLDVSHDYYESIQSSINDINAGKYYNTDIELYLYTANDASLQEFYGINPGYICDPEVEDCEIGGGDGSGTTCPSDPDVYNPNICGTDSSFADPSWECVNSNMKASDENQNATAMNKNICTVYCREEVVTNFPNNNMMFDAGSFLQIGTQSFTAATWGPISISGKYECKTFYTNSSGNLKEGVNLDAAATSYNEALANVNSTFDGYRLKKGYEDGDGVFQNTEILVSTSSKVCPEGQEDKNDNCKVAKVCPADYSTTRPPGYDGPTAPCYDEQDRYDVYIRYNEYVPTAAPITYIKGREESKWVNTGNDYATYQNAVNTLESIKKAISFCTTGTIEYNLNPEVSVEYKASETSFEDINSSLTNEDSGIISGSLGTGEFNNGSSYSFNTYSCNTSNLYAKCSLNVNGITFERLYNNTKNSVFLEKNNNYIYESGLRYIDKQFGQMHSTLPNGQYIDLGFYVIPISPTRNPANNYSINLTYSNLGHNGKFEPYQTNDSYDCLYTISNELTGKECEYGPGMAPEDCNAPGDNMGGIDVIYRPIDLYNPFPAEDGLNRNTGANWCTAGDCSYNNAVVQKVVLDNRNVTSDDVYNLQPLYVVQLDPDDIQRIREYNDSLDGNYGDFNLTCDVNGRNCKSEFIHSSEMSYLFRESDVGIGTCATWSNDFEACRF